MKVKVFSRPQTVADFFAEAINNKRTRDLRVRYATLREQRLAKVRVGEMLGLEFWTGEYRYTVNADDETETITVERYLAGIQYDEDYAFRTVWAR